MTYGDGDQSAHPTDTRRRAYHVPPPRRARHIPCDLDDRQHDRTSSQANWTGSMLAATM